MKSKILIIGDSNKNNNTFLYANAFKKIGYKIFLLDPIFLKNNFLLKLINFINCKFPINILNPFLFYMLKKKLKFINSKIDFILLNQGEFYNYKILKYLKLKLNCKIACYIVDNPFTKNEIHRFRNFRSALSLYNFFFTVRKTTYKILKKINKNTFFTSRTYDEVMHRPYPSTRKTTDIIFVGTWMRNENRDYYLKELILNKFKVKIFGDRWHKSEYYKILKPYVFPAVYKRDYAKEISKSKICLCFLNRGNEDEDTTRTYEIPFMGGLLLAERTRVHIETYEEDKEAIFFNNKHELLKKIKFILNNPSVANKIRKSGKKKIRFLKAGNKDLAKFIISKVKQ